MAQNGRTRGRKPVSRSSAKNPTRTKSAPRRIPGKKHTIVFSSMQTAILCVLIVAACFAFLIVNSGRNPKNNAVEDRIALQSADSAGKMPRTSDARQNADRRSSQKPPQSSENFVARQGTERGERYRKKTHRRELQLRGSVRLKSRFIEVRITNLPAMQSLPLPCPKDSRRAHP